jgi:hypothetical protein
MRRLAALSPRSRLAVALVLALVVGAVLVEAATLPHVHAGSAPGLYDHDHDLALMARLAGDAPLPAALPSLGAFLALAAVVLAGAAAPTSAVRAGAASRAPPLA